MATRILMPKLGLTMTEGTITEWVVSAGEKVSKGSTVMLIETDKVEAEVEAEADGVVQYIANVGDTLEPGEVVGWLLEEDEQSDGEADQTAVVEETPEVQDDTSQEPTEAELSEPEIAQSLQEEAAKSEGNNDAQQSGRIHASPNAKRVAKEKGIDLQQVTGTGPNGRITSEDINTEQPAATVTDTGRILASPNAKRVAKELGIDLGTVAGTGPGGRITSEDVTEAPQTETATQSQTASEVSAAISEEPTNLSTTPFAARKAAEQLGVDLVEVTGSGPDGRITKQDVFAHSRTSSSLKPTKTPTTSTQLDGDRTPIKGMRAIIADRMHSSLQEMAQLTLTMDVNMDRVVELREQLKDIGPD